MRKLIAYALVAAYLGAVVYVLVGLDAARNLSAIQWHEAIFLALLAVAMASVNASVLKLSCGGLGYVVPWSEALGLASANGLLNNLPVRAGLAFKALYLISIRSLPITGFASITVVNAAIALTIQGLVGAFAVLALWLAGANWEVSPLLLGVIHVLLVLGATAALVLAPTLLRLRFPFGLQRLAARIAAATATFTTNPSLIAKLAAIDLLGLAFAALRVYLITAVVGEPVGVAAAVLLTSARTIANFISIVPGAIGIREAAVSGMFVAVGGSLETGIVVATADSVISVFRDLALGGSWLLAARGRLSRLGSMKPSPDHAPEEAERRARVAAGADDS